MKSKAWFLQGKFLEFTDFLKFLLRQSSFYAIICTVSAQIAQLVAQRTENPRGAGSIPALGIFLFFRYALEKAAPEGAASFIL